MHEVVRWQLLERIFVGLAVHRVVEVLAGAAAQHDRVVVDGQLVSLERAAVVVVVVVLRLLVGILFSTVTLNGSTSCYF